MAEQPFPTEPMDQWPQEERDRYDRLMAAQADEMGIVLKPMRPTPLEAERSVTAEEIEGIINDLEIDPDPRATAARKRARRSHMVRKLKTRFDIYSPFTVEYAANELKMKPNELQGFLEFEVRMPGTLFRKQADGRFVITSPWV